MEGSDAGGGRWRRSVERSAVHEMVACAGMRTRRSSKVGRIGGTSGPAGELASRIVAHPARVGGGSRRWRWSRDSVVLIEAWSRWRHAAGRSWLLCWERIALVSEMVRERRLLVVHLSIFGWCAFWRRSQWLLRSGDAEGLERRFCAKK